QINYLFSKITPIFSYLPFSRNLFQSKSYIFLRKIIFERTNYMNVYAWIGLIGIIVAELLPFIQKSNRTRPRYIKAGIQIAIVLSVIVAVLLFQVPFLFAFLIGFLAMIVFDRKTYTKRRLLIYIPILLIISVASFILFREQPNYVLKHL